MEQNRGNALMGGPNNGSANTGMLFGAVLVLAGSVLLLERLDVLSTNLLHHFWPLFLMFAGSLIFVNGRQFAGGMLVFFGIVLELQKLRILHVRLWDLWPLAIIAVGVLMLWRALFPPRIEPGTIHTSEARVNQYTVFGGVDVKANSQAFEGGTATAIFGGVELDLRHAKITKSPAILFTDAIFGGVEVKVPENWRVTTEAQAFFGGVDAHKVLPVREGEPDQHLVIKGLVAFGGVEVKN